MIKKILRLMPLFAATLALTIASMLPVSVMAAERTQSNGLGISPRRDFTVKPGESYSDKLYISNLSLTQALEVQVSIVDFGAQNETGVPAISLDEKVPETAWSIKPFTKVQNEVSVEPGKSTYIPITVTIPKNQGAGSYYSAVRYVAVNPETKQRVNIAASTASLIFVTVPGQTKEKLTLKQFGAWESNADLTNGKFKSFYLGSSPKEFAYRLQNEGNVAESPSGSILIKNIFGKTTKEIANVNPKRQLTLIGQTRRVQVCIKADTADAQAQNANAAQTQKCDNPGLWPGRYTANLSLFYGANGNNTQDIYAAASFWYFPWWSVVVLVALAILIAVFVWLARRAFSKRHYRH